MKCVGAVANNVYKYSVRWLAATTNHKENIDSPKSEMNIFDIFRDKDGIVRSNINSFQLEVSLV